MKFLIDTHTFIWFTEGSTELSAVSRGILEDMSNDFYISISSLWEMSIKVGLGKLTLKVGDYAKVIDLVNENGFQMLGINFSHTLENTKLPLHHRDPFDRIIIAQAIVENMDIISKDAIFDDYLSDKSVKRIW